VSVRAAERGRILVTRITTGVGLLVLTLLFVAPAAYADDPPPPPSIDQYVETIPAAGGSVPSGRKKSKARVNVIPAAPTPTAPRTTSAAGESTAPMSAAPAISTPPRAARKPKPALDSAEPAITRARTEQEDVQQAESVGLAEPTHALVRPSFGSAVFRATLGDTGRGTVLFIAIILATTAAAILMRMRRREQ
jgi:hypothetical protein